MALTYPDSLTFVQNLTPTWVRPQQVMLSLLMQALCERASLSPTEQARALPAGPHSRPVQALKGRLKRVARFLDNPRLDEVEIFYRWYRLAVHFSSDVPAAPRLLPVLLDTTVSIPVICTPDQFQSLETTGTVFHGSCTNDAGIETDAEPVTIKLDKTPPVLAPSVSPNPVALNGTATGSANASDNISGIDSQGCAPVDTSTPGIHTVNCTATNDAGLTGSQPATYFVSGNLLKGEVLADLTALRATVTDKEDGKKLDEAITHLTNSLAPHLWLDGNHPQPGQGGKVFTEEKDAVNKLSGLIKDKKSTIPGATVLDFVNRLVSADRALASLAIGEAAGGDQTQIDKANEELAKGDSDAAAGKAGNAIDHYRNAWQLALRAMS